MFLLPLVILKSFQKFEKNVLGNLASSSFQVGKPGEPEVSLQIVGRGVEGPPDGQRVRVLAQFQLGRLRQCIPGFFNGGCNSRSGEGGGRRGGVYARLLWLEMVGRGSTGHLLLLLLLVVLGLLLLLVGYPDGFGLLLLGLRSLG